MAIQIIMVLSLFRVLDTLFSAFGLDTLFSLVTSFISNAATYVPTIRTWIGYVCYFVPIEYLKPLLFISFGFVGFRSVMALLHLIKW